VPLPPFSQFPGSATFEAYLKRKLCCSSGTLRDVIRAISFSGFSVSCNPMLVSSDRAEGKFRGGGVKVFGLTTTRVAIQLSSYIVQIEYDGRLKFEIALRKREGITSLQPRHAD
jgi:hypothetical protein